MTDIHSCSYYCERPECIKAQRDELRERLAQPEQERPREIAERALNALEETLKTLDDENAKPGGAIADVIWYSEHETLFDYIASEIAALREALAPPEQEPAAQCLETIMALADKYADAMERGPFSRSYQGNIQDARANLQAAVEKIAATPPQRKPLKLREIEKCIYDANNDPIVACRNVEAAHGIKENT